MINVLLASPLADDLVARIAAIDPRVELVFRAELLGQAEVMLEVDQPSAPDIVQLAPRLRWIQASSSGVGDNPRRYLNGEPLRNVVDTARGY